MALLDLETAEHRGQRGAVETDRVPVGGNSKDVKKKPLKKP